MDILSILSDKNIPYKKTNNPSTILVQCTSGLHEDKDPSLSYHLGKNLFQCWSCGFRGAGAKFLQSIGIVTKVPIETKQTFKIEKMRQKINNLLNEGEVRLPAIRHAVEFPFKGISEETLQDFEVFLTPELGLEDYVCIPVYQFGKLKFIEGRLRLKDPKRSKYYRRPTGVSASQILFPLDRLEKTKEIILVEGIFDMLNMWQHGFRNVLCIFGTQNFGQKKIELLDQIGITRAHVMMDGDSAGTRANLTIQKILESNNIQTRVVNLPEGKDPGELSRYELEQILK